MIKFFRHILKKPWNKTFYHSDRAQRRGISLWDVSQCSTWQKTKY